MKIAIVGAHSCGKTTLVYALATRLKMQNHSVAIITENARRCPFDLRTLEATKWILITQIKEELEAAKGHTHIVCDRASGDCLAYARANGHELPPYLEDLALKHLATYDRIIHLKPSSAIVNDGFRDLDESYRQRIVIEMEKIYGKEGRLFFKDLMEDPLAGAWTNYGY